TIAIAFLLMFFSWAVAPAQPVMLHPDRMREDLRMFRTILERGHPSLYGYITHDSLDAIFARAEHSLDHDLSVIAFYTLLIEVGDAVHDGHLMINPAPDAARFSSNVPIILKLIGEDFYTDTDDFGIPIGSRILAIGGVPSGEILSRLMKYAPSDGFNVTRKYRSVEMFFPQYFNYEFGQSESYEISYQMPSGERNVANLRGEPFDSLKLRNTRRNSYFANDHGSVSGVDFFKSHINPRGPFVEFVSRHGIEVAVLTVNSFGDDIIPFKDRLVQIFREIRERKAHDLIVDVRRNDGGYRPNAIHLFSYLTNIPFREIVAESVTSLAAPEHEYVTRMLLDERRFLTEKFSGYPEGDRWVLRHDSAESIMIPEDERFDGSIYVLTGGLTFSAGATFALNARNNSRISIVGEETGGGYYYHDGEFPVFYELPDSHISMVMFMERIDHVVADSTRPPGHGVMPTYPIQLTVSDLIAGKDTQLDFIFDTLIAIKYAR
ncbi:MAG: S41 family peptidase, partial [Bacteroidota bacterium]